MSGASRLFIGQVANDVDGDVLHTLNDQVLESKFTIESYSKRHKIMMAISKLFPDREYSFAALPSTMVLRISRWRFALLSSSPFLKRALLTWRLSVFVPVTRKHPRPQSTEVDGRLAKRKKIIIQGMLSLILS